MQKRSKILFFGGLIALLFLSMTACDRSANKLAHKQQQAEQELLMLQSALRSANFDSVWSVANASNDINYYVYDPSFKLVFWSENVLALGAPSISAFDTWYTLSFPNADCSCRWTRLGSYTILTAIPIRWNIANHDEIEQSFSYRQLHTGNESFSLWLSLSGRYTAVYFYLSIALFAMIILMALYTLIRNRGFRNMSLRTKLQYPIVALVMLAFGYIFAVSVRYVRRHYEEQQRAILAQKCRYIQSALQNLYFWDYSMSSISGAGLSVDLRDLAHAYGTDIHVYDMSGQLVGSSTPILFERGLLSDHLAPAIFFSKESTKTLYSYLGDRRYLSAFTDFRNGTFTQLGYIAVPSFISEEEMATEVDEYIARLLPPYLIILLLALVIAVLLARGLASPMTAMADRMRDLDFVNSHSHIDYPYNDELGLLVRRYNEMVDQLDLYTRRLARSEREGAWRTMARQVAHEINNPLTPMKLTIQQLQRVKDTDRFDELFSRATTMLIEQIDNLSRIATSFSSFARLPQVQTSVVDIAQRLTAAIALSANNTHNIPIRYVGPDSGVLVYADGEQIGQVFTNIFRNALQAIGDRQGGDIIVRLTDPYVDTAGRLNEVEISISDNGPGIPEEVREKIFVPEFTTKSGGTGLGLTISKNIVEGSDGRISFITSDKGTTFYIYLRKIQEQ